MNPETLEALAARIEAGETGKELDALAFEALKPQRYMEVRELLCEALGDGFGDRRDGILRDGVADEAPRYTASVDAAKALQEEVLPECRVYHAAQFRGLYEFGLINARGEVIYGSAPTEAAARLAALLRAYGEEGA
jgi:hypothetical protein